VALTRNTIIDAIVTRVAAVSGVRNVTRRVRDFSFSEMPAVLVVSDSQTAGANPADPALWRLTLKLLVYVHDASQAGPSAPLHDFLDAIEAALEPAPGQPANTLGGLVADARIDGTVTIDDQLGDVAVAEVPVVITAIP
jgi:hypothetical protein